MIGLSEMHEYGYFANDMYPLTKESALELFDRDLPVYLLYGDGSETAAEDREQIAGHDGIFGIEKGENPAWLDWQNEKEYRSMQAELAEGNANKEVQLLYGSSDRYGIYQLKDIPFPSVILSCRMKTGKTEHTLWILLDLLHCPILCANWKMEKNRTLLNTMTKSRK